MMRRSTIGIVASVAWLVAGAAQAADFSLGFADCPPRVTGAPGAAATIEAISTLTSANVGGPDGAQGWSISLAVEGALVKSVTVKGLSVATFFDDDGDLLDPDTGLPNPNATPLVDMPVDLIGAGFILGPTGAQKATGDYPNSPIPGTRGIVSAVVLHQTQKRVLKPAGTVTVCKTTIEATIPPEGETSTVKLSYLDGLKGVGQPVNNVVTFGGQSTKPSLGSCEIALTAPSAEFNLALVGAPDATPAASGDTVLEKNVEANKESTHEVYALLSTVRLAGPDGPQGFSISVAHDNNCMTVDSVSVKGVTVKTFFDDDGDLLDPDTGLPNPNATPLVDAPLDLIGAGFILGPTGAQKATGDYTNSTIPGTRGIVSAVVLHQTQKRVLHPNATDPVCRITYRVGPVGEGQTIECKASFLDGLKGVGQPVNNVITFGGQSKKPTISQGIVLKVTGIVPPKKDGFQRGDANNDARLDIADAVWIVYSKVLNDPAYPTPCQDSLDANGQGAKGDVPDAVYVIDYLFRGGSPPADPFRQCGTTPDSTTESCPPDSTGCPAAS